MLQKRVTDGLLYEEEVCKALSLNHTGTKRTSKNRDGKRFNILDDWNTFSSITNKHDGEKDGKYYEIKKYNKESLISGIMYSELCSIKNKSQLHNDLNTYNKWTESMPDTVIKKLNDISIDYLVINNNEVIPVNELEFFTEIITNWKGYNRITTYVRLKKIP